MSHNRNQDKMGWGEESTMDSPKRSKNLLITAMETWLLPLS